MWNIWKSLAQSEYSVSINFYYLMKTKGAKMKSSSENNTFGKWKPTKNKEKHSWAVFGTYLSLELMFLMKPVPLTIHLTTCFLLWEGVEFLAIGMAYSKP